MYNKGHTELKIDIDRIKALPYQREDIPDLHEWTEAQAYPKSIITDSICSDKSAEQLNLEWSWTDVLRIDDWKVCALSFYKLSPAHVTPWHTDHYKNFKKFYKLQDEQVIRRMVFLQNWKPGQIFCIDEETITNWKSGDWIEWTPEHRHMGANHSEEIRYTLQLTGIIQDLY
jgi:hypothetical protein